MILEEETRIETLSDIFKIDMNIPNYQRPYVWTVESASRLYNDIFDAYSSGIKEYRIGNLILNKNIEKYEIVDGQQRITTLILIIKCLGSDNHIKCLIEKLNYTENSYCSIKNNYNILKRLINRVDKNKIDEITKYILENCTMVKIVTDDLQQSFTIFDSQNSRGKSLNPHDILKAYHLREMPDVSEEEKNVLIENFQKIDEEEELVKLFKYNIYPIIQWSNKNKGNDYGLKKIDIFKGIKYNKNKVENEQFNCSIYYNTVKNNTNKLQITQPVIAGKQFFDYVENYYNLKKRVINIIENKENIPLLSDGSGDRYIKELFINIVMLFIDRFNERELSNDRLNYIYQWCYLKRITSYSVSWIGVNKYVLEENKNLFDILSKTTEPSIIDNFFIILKNSEIYERYNKKDDETTEYIFKNLREKFEIEED